MNRQEPSTQVKFYQVKPSSNLGSSNYKENSQQKQAKSQINLSKEDLRQITENQFGSTEQKHQNSIIKCQFDEVEQDGNIKRKGFNRQKIKRIQKSRNHNLNNQTIRSRGSIASKLNKKFIQIIDQQLETLNIAINFTKSYIHRFNIHGQKQNIVILPFLIMDCLVSNSNPILSKKQVIQNQSYYIAYKAEFLKIIYNTYQKIFDKLVGFLQKSYKEKVLTKLNKRHQTDSIYRKHQVLVYIQTTKHMKSHIHSILNSFQANHNFLNLMFLGSMEPQNNPLNNMIIVKSQNFCQQSISNPYIRNFLSQTIMQEENRYKQENKLDKLFDKLFKVKQRDIEKAKDKFRSIQLSTKVMRTIFEIKWDHKLKIKQLMQRSIDQNQKREYGLTKKNNHWYKDRFYDCMKSKKEKQAEKIKKQQNRDIFFLNENITSLGEDFLMAFMSISLVRRKNWNILQEFIKLINGQIEYMDETQEMVFMYDKKTYKYYVSLLSRAINKNTTKKQHLDQQQEIEREKTQKYEEDEQLSAQYSIQEWIYTKKIRKNNNQEKSQLQNQKELMIECLDSVRAIVSRYEQVRQEFRDQDLSKEGIRLKFHICTNEQVLS